MGELLVGRLLVGRWEGGGWGEHLEDKDEEGIGVMLAAATPKPQWGLGTEWARERLQNAWR